MSFDWFRYSNQYDPKERPFDHIIRQGQIDAARAEDQAAFFKSPAPPKGVPPMPPAATAGVPGVDPALQRLKRLSAEELRELVTRPPTAEEAAAIALAVSGNRARAVRKWVLRVFVFALAVGVACWYWR